MRRRAQRDIHVPEDWHQDWLEEYLQDIADVMEAMDSLANKSSTISQELSKQDVSLDVDGALDRIRTALNKASDVLEDSFSYLDVSELQNLDL